MIARNRQGMSLVELLVVIVIISILAALVLPSFKNVLSERKTNVAALEVKSFLEAARARAIARGRHVSVVLERLSSRTDNVLVDPTNPRSVTNPYRSITAANSITSIFDNYNQYNTSIRMSMAEESGSLAFDMKARIVPEVVNPVILGDDSDGVLESSRILRIAALDPRLPGLLQAGNQISLRSNGPKMRFVITRQFFDSSTNEFVITIGNDGSTQNPFGSVSDLNSVMSPVFTQRALRTNVPLVGEYDFSITSLPIPVAAISQEMPRGTCIDLSLSGLSEDDPIVNNNVTTSTFRDCQRQFASDWIITPPGIPLPSQLRPIYITFSPNGSLESISSNKPNENFLQNIEPSKDVFLFVGRTDQVVLPLDSTNNALTALGIAQRVDEGAKPNMLDPTGYWVRISATNGSIAAAPTQAWHVEQDVAEARNNPTNADDLGEMITESRALTFQSELSSQ